MESYLTTSVEFCNSNSTMYFLSKQFEVPFSGVSFDEGF